MIEVHNPRLLMLYLFFQASTGSFLIWWLFAERAFEREADIGQFISSGVSATPAPDLSVASSRLAELNATLCRTSAAHDFWLDAAGRQRLHGFKCAALCPPQPKVSGTAPFGSTERDSFMAKGDTEVFLPTSRTRVAEIDGQDASTRELLLTADAMAVNLRYFFDIPLVRPNGNPDFRRLSGSSEEVETELRASDGQRRRVYRPGEAMVFTVRELLELAGQPDQLDSPHRSAGVNRRPGSPQEGPIGRISGVELLVYVSCNGHVGTASSGISRCLMEVRKSPRGWVTERVLGQAADGGYASETLYTGVRIRLLGNGRGRHFDLGMLLSRLTTCFVIMTLPRKVVMLFCITMLGHLSTIYRQAVFDQFSLRGAIAGMAARLLVWNAAFVELVDYESDTRGHSGISERRMHERLVALLKGRGMELDPAEVTRLCHFTYKAMSSIQSNVSGFVNLDHLQDIGKEIGMRRQADQASAGMIDSDRFSVACTSAEALNFDAVVKLFDNDRRRWFMERLFTPSTLRAALDEVSCNKVAFEAEQEDCSSDASDQDTEPSAASPASRELSVVPEADTSGGGGLVRQSGTTLSLRDPGSAFTLEEERELRRNLHKKVLHLLRDSARSRQVHEEIRRSVQEHRHHFDARHREHRSTVVQATQETTQRMEELGQALRLEQQSFEERHRGLEARFLHLEQGLDTECQRRGEAATLQGLLEARLAALESRLREAAPMEEGAAEAGAPRTRGYLWCSSAPDGDSSARTTAGSRPSDEAGAAELALPAEGAAAQPRASLSWQGRGSWRPLFQATLQPRRP